MNGKMIDEKQIKITLVGSSGVGKSTFMESLIKPKKHSEIAKRQLASNNPVNEIDIRTSILNKKYRINIV
jgi:GTPase SAR1 family protein